MATLSDLPGCRRSKKAWGARSVTHAIEQVKRGRAIIAADTNGAVSAWRDDKGVLRADFSRHFLTVAEGQFSSIEKLRAFLKEWWPRMARP